MFQRIMQKVFLGFLSGQLICTGCTHIPTIKKPSYAPLVVGNALSEEALSRIKDESPKDAVFADLLQAFALMRSANLANKKNQKQILGLLATSVSTFEDMQDPINFSLAFSADEAKPFRGRPHERMFASTMAAVFLMANKNYGQALPYLRNAEFLDARFQKLPFGTDAPLIYALMYRCLLKQKASKADILRAKDGIFRSVRFLTMQGPFIDTLIKMAQVDLRPMAIANRIAYMIYEISIYHSLISAPNDFNLAQLTKDASKNASIFISALSSHFEDEYKSRMKPFIKELAGVYGMDSKKGAKYLEDLAFDRISFEANKIGKKLSTVMNTHADFKNRIEGAKQKTKELTSEIVQAAASEKLILTFSGVGPMLNREGSYQEISVIKPGKDASTSPEIRERKLSVNTSCGFHRRENGGFTLVLCNDNKKQIEPKEIRVFPSFELLSLSRKATTAQGRRFDRILKGRAQFRAATEEISRISAWSAFFLFYLGAEMIADCQRRGQDQTCYARGLGIWAVAGITAIFSGAIWLMGKAKNPAADSRFIHLMYESVWLSADQKIMG